jgi:hypothetical protein
VSSEVRAEVKAILYFGPETARDAGSFDPADPGHFGVTVQILIGETGNDLADSFDLTVCSPSWFAAEVASGRWFNQGAPLGMPTAVAVGSGLWFMRRWDREEFETAVRFVCDVYSPAPDWGSLADRIGRQIPWEFDAEYDAHVNDQFGSPFPALREE